MLALSNLDRSKHDTEPEPSKTEAMQPLVVSQTNLDTWTGKQGARTGGADAGGIVGVWTKLTGSVTERLHG